MGTVTNLKELTRPRPSSDLVTMDGLAEPDKFIAAPELTEWVRKAFIAEGGPLYAEEHGHLEQASIGFLWTTAANSRRGRQIVGQAEMPGNSAPAGKWKKARSEQQLIEWFATVPDFLITIDAVYASNAEDLAFAALIDHELCHCAQAEDEFGAPKFSQATGKPVFQIRGHDVEEFTSVVRRFGIEAAGEAATEFVIAAAQTPTIAAAKVARSCGTCTKAA